MEILARLEAKPEECLMVGNDVRDDMSAADVGLDVFLLTDCLINSAGADVSVYTNGNCDDLCEYIRKVTDPVL
jgi:FMN phosphatase YigB (HAD superfamily)